ncbi:hypothetical protein CECT5772_07999 [Streptococcus equi subsp. ruminatorum CECT 5772]|uniref:Uncharacterized protein n=1 Tax=Streptococcus equi subsp. ruminatorum CECT 5772 TaxID=1051981 RepID=A0A922T4Y3_9STRE|nr:hypothetical protein CECT5772_07999 [Streptococcus equi subsp. ruminatorum CECT 5772]
MSYLFYHICPYLAIALSENLIFTTAKSCAVELRLGFLKLTCYNRGIKKKEIDYYAICND